MTNINSLTKFKRKSWQKKQKSTKKGQLALPFQYNNWKIIQLFLQRQLQQQVLQQLWLLLLLLVQQLPF